MEKLKNYLKELDLHDIIYLFKELESEERAVIFRLLEKDRAIDIFELLDVELQQAIMESLQEKKACEILLELDPDDQARLLDELPAKITKRLMSQIPKEQREEISDLLGYPKDSAGRIMTPDFVSIRKHQSVRDAMQKIKRKGEDKETIYTIYVTDEKRKLEGVVSLRDIVMASEEQMVEEVMNTEAAWVYTLTDQEDAARKLKTYDLLSIPVVDNEHRLVGIITVDDAMDILEEETTEDLFERVGLSSLATDETSRSLRMVEGSIPQIWKVRVPFLIITLAGGMLAGAVIDAYEQTLEAVAVLAVFIPVIMDMGGNVGTQSATIFTRGFVLGHISANRFIRHFAKEVIVGFTMGVILGTGAGTIGLFWQGIPELGLVVGLSLTATVTIASALGFLIPYLLVKFGFDQVAGSGPVLTTIKDITALLIYFSLTAIFMGHML